jgi:hypothetical protein
MLMQDLFDNRGQSSLFAQSFRLDQLPDIRIKTHAHRSLFHNMLLVIKKPNHRNWVRSMKFAISNKNIFCWERFYSPYEIALLSGANLGF